mmetsp:Transcript_13010/g.25250  ORF Transcript_13010/g.25250 Transcript_13010/m.25250 type:complete len:244 (+) Transcript_13010:468-1199(+)|eukprot:CAMPEP_0171493418 /NCGR_PEP_ID=MMETSP0958-20121227/4951_1 /TAXON_ID=87120 /ORGANISM="Aurantiochytrium limacinum, Strain ATCCMYA-1381" /LENGTH=243 /DNA_ID=CAMNT_0012027039 /DNA_START=340 /DNA_END=1071 /DNA_ORIENTATION=+
MENEEGVAMVETPSSNENISSSTAAANDSAEANNSNVKDVENEDHVSVPPPLARMLSTYSDPMSEVDVGDEVYMEGNTYSDMLFTYGVKTVIDSTGARIPIEIALGEKLVGVLFTSLKGSDPVSKGVAFTDRLETIAAAGKNSFSVLYVSQDQTEADLMTFLSKHPSFYALAWDDKSTGSTLKESLGASDFFFPTLMILDQTGMCISSWGRSAVMWNPKYCLMDWKHGREGVTTAQLLIHRFF